MDAGTKTVDHYARNMARWRFWLRSLFLTAVRQETDLLYIIQKKVRSPVLDVYYAQSANIGTHTFYMVMLPIFFWYGNPYMGYNIILVLAFGVFLTGCVKDLLCLPRPRSPPLHRISLSTSAKMEYGMPSTHSSNAVSVALVFHQFAPESRLVTGISLWLLVTLISGRIYTGMHGFMDIFVGCGFGVISYWLSLIVLEKFDFNQITYNVTLTVMFILGISLSPDPVDNCPCFDDSVAFIGVVLGMMWCLGTVGTPINFVQKFAGSQSSMATLVTKALLRFVVGVAFVVVWREVSKKTLLNILPPIWRVLDQIGFRNKRRFFDQAPSGLHLNSQQVSDEILDPSPRKFVQSLGHKPEDVVGPQSEIDLYEIEQEKAGVASAATVLSGVPNTAASATIQHERQHYDFEVFMRLIVYGGIAPMVLFLAPTAFYYLNI